MYICTTIFLQPTISTIQFFQHNIQLQKINMMKFQILCIQLGNCIVMSFVPVFLLAFLNYIIYAGIKR